MSGETESEPEKILNKVVPLASLDVSDSSIKSNAILQTVSATAMLLLYFIFRRKAPWVYYPNIKNKPQHPCYQESPGFLNWIIPLITTKDTQLLSMIGLDAFMFLQTIKLLYRICFIFSLLIVPVLCTWFYKIKTTEEKTNLFVALSIWNVKEPRVYWSVLIYSYLLTIIIFYLIFIYYKRFVTLRQMYLASPASMTSVNHLKKVSRSLEGDENAVDFINVSSKTILMDRLPPEIKNDSDLLKYLESLRLGDIENVSLIHDTYLLQKLYEERDGTIQNIEKEVAIAMIKMKEFYRTQEKDCKESFGDLYVKTGDSLSNSALQIFSHSNFNSSEKVSLFNEFSNSNLFISKRWLVQNKIRFFLSKLQEINDQIVSEKKRIENLQKEDSIEIPPESQMFVDANVRNDVSFFSLQQIGSFRENSDFFSLDLPFNRRKAFVTFKDQKTAGILKQTKLGSRAFSSNVLSAPAPSDVIWKTVGKSEVTGFLFTTISLALYVLFIFAFLFLVVKIIETLGIENNEKNFLFRLFVGNKTAITLYQSILVPLVYNILLYFVPIIIKALIHMEDIYSYSEVQVRLMYRFSLFLFFNAFLVTFITSVVAQFISLSSSLSLQQILFEFKGSVIKASVFFFNTIVQRMCIGMGIVFLKPSPFLYNFLLARYVIYTRRQSQEREFTPPIDFGNHIPNLLLILPMALVYSCICPVMLIISWLFYLINYIVYKNEMLFATRNDFESGGSFWKPTVRFILYSIITFQVVTGILTYSNGLEMVSLCYIPLVFFTFILSEGLNMVFDRSCENFPLNAPEEKFLDRFAKRALQERHDILNGWKEMEAEADEDLLSIDELGLLEKPAFTTGSFYKDPSLMTSIGNVILPENFFKIVKFLKSFDQKNLFGFKNK